jgi:hypothetical protein
MTPVQRLLVAALAIVAVGSVSAHAAELLTIEQALAKSQATGRPILAMAGSKTCAPCQALLERLSTDRSIAPLVMQFVPLKVETDGEHWGEWASKYSHEGNGIPILFVIRADGEKLYGKSGAKNGNELPLFLAEHLKSAGRIFNDEQLATIKSAVSESNKALAEGDSWTAVKRIQGLSKLGTPGKLASFATPAVEADALYAKLVEEGKAALVAAQEKLSGNDKLEGVLGVLSANRVYGTLAELKKDLVSAEREISKNKTLAETLRQAEAIDRALAMAGTKTTRKSAPAALELVMTRFPGTPAAELAKVKLAELEGTAPAVGADADKPVTTTDTPLEAGAGSFRIWKDASGAFEVEAELVKVAGGKVELKKKDGQTLTVPVDRLSQEDQKLLAERK